MDNRIKVCVLAPYVFPVPAVLGGAIETLVTGLIEENKKENNLELVICSVYNKEAFELVEQKKYENVEFVWTYPKSLMSKGKYFIYRCLGKLFHVSYERLKPHYGELYKLFRKQEFDLVIAEGGDYNCIIDLARKFVPNKLVLHLHHPFEPSEHIAKAYGKLIGVSQFIVDDYMKHANGEYIEQYTLYNGINLNKFSKDLSIMEKEVLREKLGLSKDDFVVIYLGRIIQEKGVKELINAIIDIKDEHVKLLIVGSANFSEKTATQYEKEVSRLVKDHRKRIILTGYIENKEVYQYLGIADIQCVPSMWEEAAGLVVLEGMAMGIPTIVTDSGGMVEYVTDETSIIVHRENIKTEIIEAIEFLKNHREVMEIMKAKSKEHVKRYSQKRYYEEFCDIIRKMTNERNEDKSK